MPAEILPFPPRPAVSDQSRLAGSLANLLQALDEQRAAVAAWRLSLGELKQSVDRLGHSAAEYRYNLASLSVGVAQLGREAARLEQIAG